VKGRTSSEGGNTSPASARFRVKVPGWVRMTEGKKVQGKFNSGRGGSKVSLNRSWEKNWEGTLCL